MGVMLVVRTGGGGGCFLTGGAGFPISTGLESPLTGFSGGAGFRSKTGDAEGFLGATGGGLENSSLPVDGDRGMGLGPGLGGAGLGAS